MLFALQEVTDEQLLDRLYREGYYLSFLKLFRSKAMTLSPPSPAYFSFRHNHDDRIIRAIDFSRATLATTISPLSTTASGNQNQSRQQTLLQGIPSEYHLKELFYDNNYREVADRFIDYQQHEYYLLSLVALGRWDELLLLLQNQQNQEELLNDYLIIQDLLTNPARIFSRLDAIPPNRLTGWQLDILNLKEDGFSAEEIAPVVVPYLLKNQHLPALAESLFTETKETKTNAGVTPTKNYVVLYEYAITAHMVNLSEQGKTEEIKTLFRTHFNRLTTAAYQERMLFLYGWAHLLTDREEAEKIFFRLLSTNPQSHYRFQIDTVLGLAL